MKKLSLFVMCVFLSFIISCSKKVKPDIYSPDPDSRRLGVITAPNNAETMRLIIKYLDDSDELVRAAAIDKLVDIGGSGLLNHIEAKLNDTSFLVREGACAALGKIKDERAIPDLVSVAKGDKEADVRREAVKALTEYSGNKDIISPLIDSVGDIDPSVSMEAHNALCSITGVKDIARKKELWEEWYKKQSNGGSK